MTTEHYLTVDNRDVEEIIDIDMEKMHLVTFHVTGAEKSLWQELLLMLFRQRMRIWIWSLIPMTKE